MRILLVEDETPLRVAVADSLRDEGYRVLAAGDGAAGLKMAFDEKPDLIILDVMLPKQDGFQVCQAI
ncbi:MAG: response regulator, partial [Verrucomicrobiota bacterium]